MIDFPYSVAGFFVGLVVGVTGVGGGSLMTPLLVLGFGVPAVKAVGTDLLFAGLTKAGGAAAHGLKGNVDWRITGLLAAGSVPGTIAAIAVLSQLPPAGAATRVLVSTSLGAMLILTALAIVLRARLVAWAQARGGTGWISRHRTAAAIATGATIGIAVTFSSVGAGAIGVTALVLLFPLLATVRVVGTDIAHAVPITLLAGSGHAALGNVEWAMLASLLAGSLPGILLGSYLAPRLPERALRHSLAAVLVLAGGKLVLS
jgi:uncharacterized membrane protein YfcA